MRECPRRPAPAGCHRSPPSCMQRKRRQHAPVAAPAQAYCEAAQQLGTGTVTVPQRFWGRIRSGGVTRSALWTGPSPAVYGCRYFDDLFKNAPKPDMSYTEGFDLKGCIVGASSHAGQADAWLRDRRARAATCARAALQCSAECCWPAPACRLPAARAVTHLSLDGSGCCTFHCGACDSCRGHWTAQPQQHAW